MAITIRFKNVTMGTERVTWEDELREFSGMEILNALRRSEVLNCQPDIDYDLSARTGRIWSGGQRFLGEFEQVGGEHPRREKS